MICSARFVLTGLLLVAAKPASSAEIVIAKRVIGASQSANLLASHGWKPCEKGFEVREGAFVCDNGHDATAQRGLVQYVVLNQTRPEPFLAAAWSKAADVSGSANEDYALYLDLTNIDGTNVWGRIAGFSTGTHDWQRREVAVLPEKPVKRVDFYLLMRSHAGKAWFRDPELRLVKAPPGACLFDGVFVVAEGPAQVGFQVRDVAANSNFVRFPFREVPGQNPFFEGDILGLKLQWRRTSHEGVFFFDVVLTDLTGADRAATVVFALPVKVAGTKEQGAGMKQASSLERGVAPRSRLPISSPPNLLWLDDPRRSSAVDCGHEYVNAKPFRMGSNGRLSRYPLGAVACSPLPPGEGQAVRADAARVTVLAIDPAYPAFFRIGYSADTSELYLAYDIGLVREKPKCRLRFCQFNFQADWGFRAALARYYEIYPEAFRIRTPQQGLWMPFASISKVPGWQDFGFRFKEGNDETGWDNRHGILTFHYSEPGNWWMPMPANMPRSYEAAIGEARRLASQDSAAAKALFTSGCRDVDGHMVVSFANTPWCNGALWRMNSMPSLGGEVTDFKNKWNKHICEKLYGSKRDGDLDGEYVDSSEGGAPDFSREHFAAARTPLTFSLDERRPVIFPGLIAYEYVRGLAEDVHRTNKLMMANYTPTQYFWLTPQLDVLGTETDWNPGGNWQPMTDAELLYRRALCKGKPYCFLMNTQFERFPRELVEKYMKRCLAYGMFPGFFSANASEGQYFARPELYNRDRELFKKYVPLCRQVAEAGWEPITRARASDSRVYVERFGERYLTVFNDSPQRRVVTIVLEGMKPRSCRELLSGRTMEWREDKATLTLEAEDVAVFACR